MSSGGGSNKTAKKECAAVAKMRPRASQKGYQKAQKIYEKSTSAPLGVFRGSWGGHPLQKGLQHQQKIDEDHPFKWENSRAFRLVFLLLGCLDTGGRVQQTTGK